ARAALGRKQNAQKLQAQLTPAEQAMFIELSHKVINALIADKLPTEPD
ncbi:MarR family transcriptional regulator, partial [Proteus mirabilis]